MRMKTGEWGNEMRKLFCCPQRRKLSLEKLKCYLRNEQQTEEIADNDFY